MSTLDENPNYFMYICHICMKKRHSEKNQETVGVLYLVYESSYINFIKYITPILERSMYSFDERRPEKLRCN